MKIQNLWLILVIVIFSNNAFSNYSINGTVYDDQNYPVPDVLIEFISELDTNNVFSDITDQTGMYQIQVALTDIKEHDLKVPQKSSLKQNYPNPFNPSTVIEYDISTPTNVVMEIYNILGERVKTLVNSFHQSGNYRITWDATDDYGRTISSGIYFYKMRASHFSDTKKMLLIDGSNTIIRKYSKAQINNTQNLTTFNEVTFKLRASGEFIEPFEISGIAITKDTILNINVVRKIVEEDIGPDGGTISIDNENSSLNGFKIEIPPNALNNNTKISVQIRKKVDYNLPNEAFQRVEETIELKPHNIQFKEYVKIKIPFNVNAYSDSVPSIALYDSVNNKWQIPTYSNFNEDSCFIEIIVKHFSFIERLDDYFQGTIETDPPFDFNNNVFPIENESPLEACCWGIVSYARWFLKNNTNNLRTYYSNSASIKIAEECSNLQDTKVNKILKTIDLFNSGLGLKYDWVYVQIRDHLLIENRPQILGLFTPTQGQHAVLVYKIEDFYKLYIYDPNDNVNFKILTYIPVGVFLPYSEISKYNLYYHLRIDETGIEDIFNKYENIPETGTMTDQDGNVYKTVKIGDQWWMAENLKVRNYRNGDDIPNVTNNTEWANLNTGAYCYYDNNSNHHDVYGVLYNWFAVDDNRNIAPEGWHVPTDEEWKKLEIYLGMSQSEADKPGKRGTDEGGKLKEAGTTHWKSPNTGATNESGFTALPSGFRLDHLGTFSTMGSYTFFWTATEYNTHIIWIRILMSSNATVRRNYGGSKWAGFPLRLVRD